MLENQFVAIDFETANPTRSSACAIGYAIIVNGEIVKTGSHFIKPTPNHFDSYHTHLHNISPKEVKNSPGFLEVWNSLQPHFSNKPLVAHNASFDMSVLRHALDLSNSPYPKTTYFCTRIFAKMLWPGLINYRLLTVASHLGVKFRHHDPEDDAMACARVALKACQEKEVASLEDLANTLKRKPGRLFGDGYSPPDGSSARWRGTKINLSTLTADAENFDPSHPFYSQRVVFTGTLQSMTRQEAAQRVVNVGGECANNVSAKVNFLIVGDQDYSLFVDGRKSGKMKKAELLIAKGQVMEIIPEEEFLALLDI